MFRTVTSRLTLFYTVLFTAVSSIILILLYPALSNIITQNLDREILEDVEEYQSRYRRRGVGGLQRELYRDAHDKGIEHVFYRIFSSDGEILATSDLSSWPNLDDRLDPPHDLDRRESVFTTTAVPGHDHNVRILFLGLSGGSVIQAGYSMEEEDVFLSLYRDISKVAILVMFFSGGLIGWLVVRKAMSGVDRVTQTAARIGKGNIQLRVPLGKEGEEIERLAVTFNEMLEKINALVNELKEVTNNIAHDLRSPITSIRGTAETTLTGEQTIEEYRDMAGRVIEESDRLVNMINTMLEIAESDAGVADLCFKPVDLIQMIQSVQDLFQPLADEKHITLRIDLPSHPLVVQGEKKRLQHVLANLLDNAIKFVPEGGEIIIAAEEHNTLAEITVKDSGQGISEEDLPHIFERFYRGDRSRSDIGNGLGLSLVRSLVKAHGGEVAVDSHPGNGSRFTIRLPLFHDDVNGTGYAVD